MVKQKVILIGGPTGVGKTALAIKLARLFDGEIISCDSVAIYKKLNIGSAKPTPEEQKQAKHYMIDIVEPENEYSVSDYRNEAERLILDIASRGKVPIVVGGTGLYMKALLFPMELGKSEKNEDVRQKYRQLALEKGNQFLLDYLKQIDPQSAQNLHEKDLPRIIRAIEIYETTGKKKSDYKTELKSKFDYKLFLLNDDRKVLYDRINVRVDKMLQDGLEQEVKSLVNAGLTRENQSMHAIGYKEWFDYFEGKISKEQLISQIKQNSRHYAKRQLTWFKAMPNVEIADCKNTQGIVEEVERFLKSKNNKASCN